MPGGKIRINALTSIIMRLTP